MSYCGGSWVEISARQVAENVRAVADATGKGPGGVIAVIKADAYGHGAPLVAQALRAAGIRKFAVAYVAEGEEIRAAVPDADLIFLLGRATAADIPRLRQAGITSAVVSTEHAQELSQAALAAGGAPLPVHLKLDTGMGRLGFVCPDQLPDATSVLSLPGLRVEGLCMHFAKVEPESDPAWAATQIRKFQLAGTVLEAAAGRPLFRHTSATRAALLLPSADHDAVRVGIALYGYETADVPGGRFATAPILSWKTRVVQVKPVPVGFHCGYDATWTAARPSVLATLSVGYADGYRRSFANRAPVLLNGARCPVAGRVSMNWLIVDATEAAGPSADAVKVGDEAVLIGRQRDASVWADELAALDHTISYEILTSISHRLERRMVD